MLANVRPWFIKKQNTYKKAHNFLFTDPTVSRLSNDAKILYVLLFDLACLSYENSKNSEYWINSYGEVFVHCTLKTICEKVNCGHDKAAKLLRELVTVGLIRKRSRGNGRAAEIILLDPDLRIGKSEPTGSENSKPGVRESRSSRCEKADTNNTDIGNTESISEPHSANEEYTRENVEARIKENIYYDVLWIELPEHRSTLEGILEVIVSTICSGQSTVRINQEDCDIGLVRDRYYALDDMDVRYAIDRIKDMDVPIKSFRAFCRSILYDSKYASEAYYESKFNHDMAAGKLRF